MDAGAFDRAVLCAEDAADEEDTGALRAADEAAGLWLAETGAAAAGLRRLLLGEAAGCAACGFSACTAATVAVDPAGGTAEGRFMTNASLRELSFMLVVQLSLISGYLRAKDSMRVRTNSNRKI